jgi:hypothetical protein
MPVKRKKKVIITTAAVIVLLILAALWFFTPISFLNVKPQGTYQINLTVNGHEMTATMENNTSSWALHRLLEHGPRTIRLRDYEGMEKVGMLWQGLPSNNEEISAEPGDLILFMGGSFVIYYNTNHWNFTRLGHINNVSQEELQEILGSGNVTVILSLGQAQPESDSAEDMQSKPEAESPNTDTKGDERDMKIALTVGDTKLTATLADNSSADALLELLKSGPVTVDMNDYGGMEKVGSLGTDLPANNEQITTSAGDLILYQDKMLVIYYAPNSWNFTRLGKIDGNLSGKELKEILGNDSVSVTLSLQ